MGDGPIIPDLDIWIGALSRQQPDPLVVHAMGELLGQRRLHLLGWLRQGLLARAADERAFTRLAQILTAFPLLPVLAEDHLEAARRTRALRAQGLHLSAWQALVWTVAERIGGTVWSQSRAWRALRRYGCPLHAAA